MGTYDKSSKWLIERHGDAILWLAGVRNIESWRPLPAEVVQPRELPDGLLEVRIQGEPEPRQFILELATYPERRLTEQLTGDALLVFLAHGRLPETVALWSSILKASSRRNGPPPCAVHWASRS